MEAALFSAMLSDKYITDLKKLRYKYRSDFDDFLPLLKSICWEELPLYDFCGEKLVYLKSVAGTNLSAVKLLYTAQKSPYGAKALEEEILATNAIESITLSRKSVRSIIKGHAPEDEEETRILGIKKGFEFISDRGNGINKENIYRLYMMTIGNFLGEDEKLAEGRFYRHDDVFVVGGKVEHKGLSAQKVSEYMDGLIAFAASDDGMNDLVKAAVIHFYLAYIHPYFDGNGRMARLLHMWFLIQKGYETTLFVPFSDYIAKSKNRYYGAFTLAEENFKISGKLDVTPFILYFTENVYDKITDGNVSPDTLNIYKSAIDKGELTLKERELWQFVLSSYGGEAFTTKRLEKDFGNAAYATVRSFVKKFTEMELLDEVKLKNKCIYSVK